MNNQPSTHQQIEGDYNAQASGPGARASVNVTHIHGQEYRPPLQRPPRAEHFTNRESELTTLLERLQPGQVFTLCGPGGIGKTALAAEALWTLAPHDKLPDHFPDGIFYHTFYNQPQADVALESLALAFGEEAKPSPQAAARRALAGRAALLLLDGAEDADRLADVLDVKGRCGVLITSRKHSDAPTEWQDIRPLPPHEAVALLRKWGGDLAADSAATEAVCRLVGHLPLAVRLAGRYLAQTGDSAAEYLTWLQATPLEALDQGERRRDSVPVLLERSLSQVSEMAGQVLAVAGLLALAPVERAALAAALAVSPDSLRHPLRELMDFGLMQRSGAGYSVSHALILTYARSLAGPAAAPGRLVEYYSALFKTRSEEGNAGFERLHPTRPHVLVLLKRLEPQQTPDTFTLLNAVDNYFMLQGFNTERRLGWQAGLGLARATENTAQQANCIKALGDVHLRLAEYEAARSRYEEARPIYAQIGDRLGEANCIKALGDVHRMLAEYEAARSRYEEARPIYAQIGDRLGEANCIQALGEVHLSLAEYEAARSRYEEARPIYAQIGARHSIAATLAYLGLSYQGLKQIEQARDYLSQAVAIFEAIKSPYAQMVQGWLENLEGE